MTLPQPAPDLDRIARNLTYLDLAHVTPEESTAYEHELSAIDAFYFSLESTTEALKVSPLPHLWQQLHPMLSDAAALLSSQIAPLLDLNAERSFPMSEQAVEKPLALASH